MMTQNANHRHQCVARNVKILPRIGGLENMSIVTAIAKAKQENSQMNAAVNAPSLAKRLAKEDSIRENVNPGMMTQNANHHHPRN